MKNLGIILIVAGIAMLIIRGFTYTEKEEVLDLGRVEINKETTKTVYWPMYLGGAAVVAGLVLVLVGAKRKA